MNAYFIEYDNTTDLVNGISITITSGNNLYYADCYELLKPITDIFYKAIGNPVKSSIYVNPPTDIQLQLTLEEARRLLCVYVIAPHKNGNTYHIHGFIYGLQNFNIPTNDFIAYVNKEIKKLNKLSSNNKNAVLLKPIEDLLDKRIREENSYEPLLHYIKNPEFNSYTHYLKHKNSNQFIYSYL